MTPVAGVSLPDRLLDATAALFAEAGWRRLTMTKVADLAGVSRQTVYNEFGSKPGLAQALVMREVGRFLDVMRIRFAAEQAFADALRSAIEGALVFGVDNAVLHAILGTTGSDTDLLPFLVRSQELLDTARGFLHELVSEGYPEMASRRGLDVALDCVVRLGVSHLAQPVDPPEVTAGRLAWLAVGALNGPSAP